MGRSQQQGQQGELPLRTSLPLVYYFCAGTTIVPIYDLDN